MELLQQVILEFAKTNWKALNNFQADIEAFTNDVVNQFESDWDSGQIGVFELSQFETKSGRPEILTAEYNEYFLV